MKKITLIFAFLQLTLLILSCSKPITTKSNNNSVQKVLLFKDNVPQTIKDSIFKAFKSSRIDFRISKNNSDLIWLKYESLNPLNIKENIGMLSENKISLKYNIDFDSINYNPCTCNACNVGNFNSKKTLALVGNATKHTTQSIDVITGYGNGSSDFPKNNEDIPFADCVFGGAAPAPISIVCPPKCCCCSNITSKTFLYQTPMVDNRMNLYDLLEAIYWAKNTNIDVLVLPFSYKFTKEIDLIFNKVFDDIKGNKLLLVSGFAGSSDVYPSKFSSTSNNMLAISNSKSATGNLPDISRLVTFTQNLISTDIPILNKTSLKSLVK